MSIIPGYDRWRLASPPEQERVIRCPECDEPYNTEEYETCPYCYEAGETGEEP